MTNQEIIDYIRYEIMEPTARVAGATGIQRAIDTGIDLLGQTLAAACPEYFTVRKSLQAANTNTPVFDLPSDLIHLLRVWDLDDNAGSVTGAADNGSGVIRLTVASHGFSDEDMVTVHDVGGTTEANDTWQIDYITANTFDLAGSTFANAYTSGGKVFKESDDTTKYPLSRMPSKEETLADENKYFLRGSSIVVNDYDFENDLLILYRYYPTTLATIPARFHYGIVAFGVVDRLVLPKGQVQSGGGYVPHPDYANLKKNYDKNMDFWKMCQAQAAAFSPVIANNNISDVKRIKRWL